MGVSLSYTYARIPIGMATRELQTLAEREYEEVGQKDLDRLNVDWARYGELDAAGKLATFIAKRDGAIVGEGTIAELSSQRARTVVLELVDPATTIELPGCELTDRTGTRVTLQHHGDVGPLLQALSLQ